MTRTNRFRVVYAIAAAVTIVIGLASHLSPPVFGAAIKDKSGDMLWAAMMFWLVSFVLPERSLLVRSLVALGVCFAVETSQLYHAPFIDGLRATLPGHLVLGSGFDPLDLSAYAAGVLVATSLDWLSRRASISI